MDTLGCHKYYNEQKFVVKYAANGCAYNVYKGGDIEEVKKKIALSEKLFDTTCSYDAGSEFLKPGATIRQLLIPASLEYQLVQRAKKQNQTLEKVIFDILNKAVEELKVDEGKLVKLFEGEFFKKAPAMASLEHTGNPSPDHVRSCLLELSRYLGSIENMARRALSRE